MPLYLIPKNAPGFESEDTLAAYVRDKQIDTDAMIVVKGTPMRMEPQLKLTPIDGTAEKKREPKAPKEPTAEIKSAIIGAFAEGAALTKAKVHTAIPGYGTDTIDNAIDWLTHTGKLTRAAKTYRAAKVADTAAQS